MLLENHISITFRTYSHLRDSCQTSLVTFWPILFNLKLKKNILTRKKALISAKSAQVV